MPTLYNADHQTAILDDAIIAPGEPHTFTAEEFRNGVSGVWSADPLRAGLPAEVAFKAKRDAPQAPPLHGPGSGLDAWRNYADSLRIDLPDDATKALIVQAIESASDDVQDADEKSPEANDDPAEPDKKE